MYRVEENFRLRSRPKRLLQRLAFLDRTWLLQVQEHAASRTGPLTKKQRSGPARLCGERPATIAAHHVGLHVLYLLGGNRH